MNQADKDLQDFFDNLEKGIKYEQGFRSNHDYLGHGRLVDVKQTCFHDIRIYEDGYEESYYIGD